MNALEIDKALAELINEKWKEGEAKLALLPKEAKNERKALQIEIGMYSLFLRFGLLFDMKKGDTYEEQRSHVLWIREKMILREELLSLFPKIKRVYEVADDDEKKLVIATLQGEMYMRNSFYINNLKALQEAKKCNDVEKSFEFGLKCSVLEDGFRIWEKWREENGIYYGMFEQGVSK